MKSIVSKTTSQLVAMAAMLALVSGIAAGTPGDLDPTFGDLGIVRTTIGIDNHGLALAIQPDGKLVIAGRSHNGVSIEFAIARYEANGTLDLTFGGGGIVTTPIGNGPDIPFGIAVQPDGKLVAAGIMWNGTDNDVALARYTPEGFMDVTFGVGGMVVTAVGPHHDQGRAIVIQPDGKLLVGGSSWNGANTDFVLLRYNIDGMLDATFGAGGIVTTDGFGGTDEGLALALAPDQMVMLAGYSATPYDDAVILRYLSDGTLDSSFGNGGISTTSALFPDFFYGVVVQPDGMIVGGGYSLIGSTIQMFLARFTQQGVFDEDFGQDGIVTVPDGAQGFSLLIDPVGNLVVAGEPAFTVARYNNLGLLDNDFGAGGSVTTISNLYSARAIIRQQDGKLVVGGLFTRGTGNRGFALARYLGSFCGDGSLHPGEACDDGNAVNGDCCSAACQFEVNGSPCTDSSVCTTVDQCDGLGSCIGSAALSCDDGNACTVDGCDLVIGCTNDPQPNAGCKTAQTSILSLNQNGGIGDKQLFKWLKGQALDQTVDLGDPTGKTEYGVCIFSGPTHALLESFTVPAAGGNWNAISDNGYQYKEPTGANGGLNKILLKGGSAGKTKVVVKGKGDNLPDPVLTNLPLPVTAQIINRDTGVCVEAVFDSGHVKKNTETMFKAKAQQDP